MKSSKTVALIGAGFSGLTLAWHLKKLGCEVEIFESKDQAGGLIQTLKKKVLVETAAHALLASAAVEELFQELDLKIAVAGHQSKKKWIYRNRARNWTLSLVETAQVIFSYLATLMKGQKWPRPKETVAQWIQRIGTRELSDFVAAPALQGIYGAQVEDLSASLIIGGVFSPEIKPARGIRNGSLAPVEGMGELIRKLREKLEDLGVKIHFGSSENLETLKSRFDAVVIATSAKQASVLLKTSAPEFSRRLGQLPHVSLLTATLGYLEKSRRVQGFGCLFPKKENFQSLGVLFNTDLFENRGPLESETWILPSDCLKKSDSEVLEAIQVDRSRLIDEKLKIEFSEIIRWPDVLPLYGIELESLLESNLWTGKKASLKIPALNVFFEGARIAGSSYPVYLTGNYLGGIGLAKILSYNQRLAQRIQKEIES
jgi:oxygen-dependent protoporphyrinogen oxidase